MPAYHRDGDIICFFQSASKFKARYATLGFTDKAKLDNGNVWPTYFALAKLTPADEAKLVRHVGKEGRQLGSGPTSGRPSYARVEEAAWLTVGSTVHTRTAPGSSDRHPSIIGIRPIRSALAETPLSVPERAMLDLVGRQAFLPAAVLGDVLGRDARWGCAAAESVAGPGCCAW
jgi:hypothetical protein